MLSRFTSVLTDAAQFAEFQIMYGHLVHLRCIFLIEALMMAGAYANRQ